MQVQAAPVMPAAPVPVASAGTTTSSNSITSNNNKESIGKKGAMTVPIPPPPPQKKAAASHRSSKPLLHWFQRKLGATVTKKRKSSPIPLRPTNRVVSVPLASLPSATGNGISRNARQTISLNGDSLDERASEFDNDHGNDNDDDMSDRSDSVYSPTSADEDASVRPIPPSSPPSPSPSRSSSSYLSNPRTFRSIAASTKPTTLLSIDLHGGGMAHIAQAPITPTRHQHGRNASTTSGAGGGAASVTFSALPPETNEGGSTVQAPLHTQHHPRNNPRPSSPPMDNASVLTLASSAYAHAGLRPGAVTPVWGSSAPPSAVVGGGGADSFSQYGGSMYAESQFPLGEDDRDVDASVRALRPRSSRRGSWESEVSRWSARIQVGTPSLARERSLWGGNSVRTGTGEGMEVYDNDKEDDEEQDEETPTTGVMMADQQQHSADTVAVRPEDVPLPPDLTESPTIVVVNPT